MNANLACDKFWANKNIYHDAEKKYYENLAKVKMLVCAFGELVGAGLVCSFEGNFTFVETMLSAAVFTALLVHMCIWGLRLIIKVGKDLGGGVGKTKLSQETFPKTSLAGEVAKARQHIKSSLECMDQTMNGVGGWSNARITGLLEKMETAIVNLTRRVEVLEKKCETCAHANPIAICPVKPQVQSSGGKAPAKPAKEDDDDDDDVDLFGSDSEEEDEQSKKIREQRLAEYAAKKSKKPALVAKSNIILDIKPWDDETDMKEMEKAVRAIEMDGLVWGASKLVPVAFKIFKLQISCVVEDDKVSVDLLTDALEAIEDYVQSVDIAAFNKV